MDRLLELLLRRFVRRGTLRFTTARGSVFTVGDGSGPPVAIRFMTKAAQRGVLLDPELKLGEAYMDGTFADGARLDRRPARDRARPDHRRHAAELGAAAMVAALFLPAAAAAQRARRARGATSRTTTISTAGSIRCSSTPTGNTPAPISSTPTSRSTTPSWPRSAISPPSCCRRTTSACSTSAAAGAGLRSISRNSAAPASPASRCRTSNGSAPANARLKRT